jgi:tetratricopeptide (TPR) repeat protein
MNPTSGPAALALVVAVLASASAAAPAAQSNAPPPGPAAAGDPLPGTPAAKTQAADHRAKGEAALAAGRFAEAERELSQALALDPRDAVAKQELARALFSLASESRKAKQYAQAADAFQRYTALRPDEPAGYFGLADALRQSGKPLEALAAYSTYVQKEDRPSEQASVTRAKERIAELQKIVRGGAAAPPVLPAAPDAGSIVVVRTPGDEAPDAGAAEAAAAATAAAAAADVATARIIDGDLAFATKDYRMALFAYQDAILAQPANAKARFKAGQAYARLGYDEEAIGQWNHVLVLEPQNPEVHELIAQAQARNAHRARQKVGGGSLYGAGLPASGPPLPAPAASGGTAGTVPSAAPAPVHPSPPAAAPSPEAAAAAEVRKHYAAGVALVRSAPGATGDQRAKKYQDAIAELDLALAARPAYAVALIARGSAHLGLGQLQEAAQDYSAAHEVDPALAAPLFGLAEAYRGQGQAQKAADLYREFASSTALDADADLKTYALKTAQTLSPR